jgi:lysozyme family protein
VFARPSKPEIPGSLIDPPATFASSRLENTMSASSYDAALARVLAHEGGYTNHPSDPGGPTNFGITVADYRRYVRSDGTAADVKAMRLDQAKAIYRAAYWDAMCCDHLPAGLDYAVFDYGVNSGIGRAARVLQRLLGLPDDGRMTDAVLAAACACDPAEMIARLCDERLAFLKALKTWPVFGAGWSRRVAEVRAVALDMASRAATGTAPSQSAPTSQPTARPSPTDAKPRAAAVGVFAAVAAATAQWAHQAGSHAAAMAVVVLTLVVGGWLLWRWRRARR